MRLQCYQTCYHVAARTARSLPLLALGIYAHMPAPTLSVYVDYYGGPSLIGPMVHIKTYTFNHFYSQYFGPINYGPP